MLSWLSDFIDSVAPSATVRRQHPLHRFSLATVGVVFVLFSTVIIAYDMIFPAQQSTSSLRVGSFIEQDIRAPFNITYPSEVLTEQNRQTAAERLAPIYAPPDPATTRQQVTLLQQILDFIDNIRRDPFGTPEQKMLDLQAITALRLEMEVITGILALDETTWRAVGGEAINILERVMREPIREGEVSAVAEQLPLQVATRFDQRTINVIVALVKDVLRPNRFVNVEASNNARQEVMNAVQPESRNFAQGQIVVARDTRLDAVGYEALERLGLLAVTDRRAQNILRAFLTSVFSVVLIGLYLTRFSDPAYMRTRFLAVLTIIFLLYLLSARLFAGSDPPYYIYPASGLALLLVAITKPEIAVIGTLIQGLMIGSIANNSLEITTLVIGGGMMGALLLRRTERLNSYFVMGVVVAITNISIAALFNLEQINNGAASTLTILFLYAVINGVLSAMVALVGLYVLTFTLNLPTSLKLVELSQPSQPLLQRFLQEAPGTYQHSLQVANLCEQAANAVGANAQLIRVAALYHDIGKMLNPAFFVENQVDALNPHDALNDPYRSASIIIGHVTEGERLAKQYRLPVRVRDFILEHHGTTKVGYFYTWAVTQAGDTESVDADQFTYPGPKPQSRETAIIMLADSCESTVRARKPANKQEISDIVDVIFEQRMRDGQLAEANLTLRDLDMTRDIFIEMLQAVFHPRINYPSATTAGRVQIEKELPRDSVLLTSTTATSSKTKTMELPFVVDDSVERRSEIEMSDPPPVYATRKQPSEIRPLVTLDDDDAPLQEVPPLRRTQRLNHVEDDNLPDKNNDKLAH